MMPVLGSGRTGSPRTTSGRGSERPLQISGMDRTIRKTLSDQDGAHVDEHEQADRSPRAEHRPDISDPAVLDALAHPVRLDVLAYLMSAGPATASECARAVGDSPSNCSYHLRVLAAHGLVEPAHATDGRTRPWRATITGFTNDDTDPADRVGLDAMLAAALQLDHQLAREHLRTRDTLPEVWRSADVHAQYGLRITPDELADVVARIDAIVRPYIAPIRDVAPDDAAHVHLTLTAFPRPGFDPAAARSGPAA
ncbi:ArsR family transcriptional regulator [Curtobacterium sp. MCBD17_028]|nr:ArsR family transcriptional regulator [Curtobacterium sp. MCBD17_028]